MKTSRKAEIGKKNEFDGCEFHEREKHEQKHGVKKVQRTWTGNSLASL